MNLVNFIDKFNNYYRNNDKKRKYNFDYLKKFTNKKKLYIGYSNLENKNFIREYDIQKIKNQIKNYDLLVINKNICYESRRLINDLLNLCKLSKKNVIFNGYTCLINLNIDNYNKMFRPIDITKYPFSIENNTILELSFLKKIYLIYIILLLFFLYNSFTKDEYIYKITTILFLFFVFIIPLKKRILVKNEKY